VAGGRWQAEWIFAPLAGRQGHPGATVRLLYHLLGGRWVLGALGVGCWALGVGCPEAATDEVSGPGYFARRLLTSFRSTPHVGVAIRGGYFLVWALGAAEGVGCWALGAEGVGCAAGPPPGRWVFGGSATRSLYRDFDGPSESPDRAHHDGIVGVAVGAP
jgi:hypothetical protein